MKKERFALRRSFHAAAVLALTLALWATAPAARAGGPITVHTVNNVPGDGLCSLQEAVEAANTDTSQDAGACPAGSPAVTDLIQFNISGGGMHTITLTSGLSLSTPMSIDGTTQPGYAGTPLIHVTGNFNATGLIDVGADGAGSSIMGLQFTNTYPGPSHAYAVMVYEDGVTLKSNYFNTDGASHVGTNGAGIWLASSNNLIGTGLAADRNLFGGQIGITMIAGSLNFVLGNYFGVQAGGSTALVGIAPAGPAIHIKPVVSTSGNLIRGNVIAGFDTGVMLDWPTHNNTVGGNYIGVGADGVTSLGNRVGVLIQGSAGNIIGGTTAFDRNVISGNADYHVRTEMLSYLPSGNIIQGNYIGTTADGMSVVSPAADGIYLLDGSDTEIGGTTAGSGNLISGNSNGIFVGAGATGSVIRGNWIGTDATGTNALANVVGIYVIVGSANIGDETTPGNNVIIR